MEHELDDALSLSLPNDDALLDGVDLLARGAEDVGSGVEREGASGPGDREASAVEGDLGADDVLAVRVGDRDDERGNSRVHLGEPPYALAPNHRGAAVIRAPHELGAARDELAFVAFRLTALGRRDALRGLSLGVRRRARREREQRGQGRDRQVAQGPGEPHRTRVPRGRKAGPKTLYPWGVSRALAGTARPALIRASIVAGVGVVLAKVLISCVDLESLGNGPPDAAAPPTDGSVPDVVDPCTHDQPAITSDRDDTDGGADLPTFVLALDTVSLDSKKVSPLDLDGVCTCDPRQGTFANGAPSCAGTVLTCDGDGGGDNALGAVIESSQVLSGIEGVSNRLIASGHRTLLLQIQKYNGLPNDSEVTVGTLVGVGIRSKACSMSVFDPAAGYWSTGKCGDDPWTISPASGVVGGSGIAPYAIGRGYVRDGQLVVRLNNAALIPFNDESTIAFRNPILSGRLVPLGEDLAPRDPDRTPTEKEKRLFRLENGLLAARLLATDALATIGTHRQSGTGTRLCESAGFVLLRKQFCEATDLLGQPQEKQAFDPTKPCVAISAALGFAAIPAIQAYVSDAGTPPTGCEGVDAATFLCP